MPGKKVQSVEKRRALNRERMQTVRQSVIESVVQGSLHQGSEILTQENRGRQCSCMSLIALIRSQQCSPEHWTKDEIDDIVFTGDQSYSSCNRENAHIMIELPNPLSEKNKNYATQY